jgi:hypothetical protein
MQPSRFAFSTPCCENCGTEIPTERLEVLPDTKTCVSCSTVRAKVGFMVYGHKTAGTAVFVDPSDTETLRLAKRGNARSR